MSYKGKNLILTIEDRADEKKSVIQRLKDYILPTLKASAVAISISILIPAIIHTQSGWLLNKLYLAVLIFAFTKWFEQ